MQQTQQIGEAVFAIASDSPPWANYYTQIKNQMKSNDRVIEKNRRILANLQSQMEDIETEFKIFTDLSKKREQTRKKYDHYRVKLGKLREKEAKQ